MRRVKSASHVGAIAQHRRELQNLEVLVLVADTILSVEYIMLASAFENNHHWHQQWRQHDDGNAGEDDVKEAFEEFIHSEIFLLTGLTRLTGFCFNH